MKNEHRGILAVVLSVAVLIFWYSVVAPPQSPPPSPSTPIESSLPEGVKVAEKIPLQEESKTPAVATSEPRLKGEEFVLENGEMSITFDTVGGIVRKWELKNFTKNGEETQKNVDLADFQGAILDLQFRNANFNIPYPIPFEVVSHGGDHVDLRWRSEELTLLKRVRLEPNAYLARMELEAINHKKETLEFVPVIEWSRIPSEESPQRGVLFFKSPPDRWQPLFYHDDSLTILAPEKINTPSVTEGKIGWAGFESRYFLGSVVPTGKEANGLEKGGQILPNGETLLYMRLLLPGVQILPESRWLQKFNLYGGPKELKSLETVGPGIDKAIGYGWTSIVAIPMLHLLRFFYSVVHNYGIAIILLTILVKVLLNPINRKSLQSMKAMQALQPKIKELREKFGNDKQRLNQETMQLFKKHKVNPMGGCLPMLLQFPIYIALYKVLWSSVELYHAPFFWFYTDLSAPDPYLITPALLGVTMFFQVKMTPNPSVDPAQQKIMLIMPLMFCVIMVFLPMGLGLYILVNTLMTILQQWMYQKGIRFRDLVRGKGAVSYR